jgi:polar amino acid transport system substrate-binding protein
MNFVRKMLLLVFCSTMLTMVVFGQTEYSLVTEEYPPYEYLLSDKPVGMDIDILTAAAKIAGIKFKIDFVPWKRAEKAVEDGTADGIFCCFITPEREKFLYFPSVNLGFERIVIFANSSFTGKPTKLEDLKGSKIGTVASNSYGEVFDNYTGVTKLESPDSETLFKNLNDGRIQLAITNEIVGWYLIKTLRLDKIKLLPVEVYSGALYVGFSKASPKGKVFYEKMQAALVQLQKSGELTRIIFDEIKGTETLVVENPEILFTKEQPRSLYGKAAVSIQRPGPHFSQQNRVNRLL